jgi:hypothetical protein
MIEQNLVYYVAKQDISIKTHLRCLFYSEGDSEVFLLEKILQQLSAIPDQNAIVCFAGILGNFTAKIRVPTKYGNFSRLSACGFLLDADDNPKGRIDLMRDAATAIGFPAPGDDGFGQTGGRMFGVFISPGNGAAGRIEDIVLRELMTTELWPCVTAFTKCTDSAGSPMDSKAIVQSYISIRSPGICGVGRAFEAGVLQVAHSAYDQIRNFVQRLILVSSNA